MFILQVLVVVFVIGYFYGQHNKKADTQLYDNLVKRLQAELQKTKNKQVKEVLASILGITTIESSSKPEQLAPKAPDSVTNDQTKPKDTPKPAIYSEPVAQISTTKSTDIHSMKSYLDSTSMLLYFGAFLFISSVGLFVAFGGVDGAQRTALVALISILMYGSGFYLWNTKNKLKQVGEAFIGIGMMAIPFVGITAYNNSQGQSNAASIWVITSLVAVTAYTMTVVYIRSTFVSYLLIGSLVSLVQSFVGISDGPIYYFIWALAVTGILLQFLSIVSNKITTLKDASSTSGQIFIPITIFTSLLLVNSWGFAQLAMTTGLATLYYLLLAVTDKTYRRDYIGLSHILIIATILLSTFSISGTILDLSKSLIIIAFVHLVSLIVFKVYLSNDIIHKNIMLVSAIFISLFALIDYEPEFIVAGIVTFFIISSLATYLYKQLNNLLMSLGSWIALSYAIGQLLPDKRFENLDQAILSIIFVMPFVVILSLQKFGLDENWKLAVKNFLLVGLLIALGVGLASGAYHVIFLSVWVFVITTVTKFIDKNNDQDQSYLYFSLLFAGTPLLYAIFTRTHISEPGYFSIATVLFLGITIAISLLYKFEPARWLSTIAWLILPLAIMSDRVLGLEFQVSNVLWMYFVVMLCLAISRAIARGKILPNYNIPIASLAKSSSESYMYGLLFAAGIVYCASFLESSNVYLPTLYIITVTAFLTWFYVKIEKSHYFSSLIPIFAQVALLRLIEPYTSETQILDLNKNIIYPVLSSALAICFYLEYVFTEINKKSSEYFREISLGEFYTIVLSTAFIAPLSFVFGLSISWAMPITLIAGGTALLVYNWYNTQSKKEVIGALVFIGFMWLLYYWGLDNIQIYTHLLAALFALYAYIRHKLKDTGVSDQYIVAMLATSTIPLIIQSLGSSASGEYLGLWLLLEQIGFMLLGILIHNSFVTKWGLYVAIGAVIYQLRELGWAMLAVLSLFIIGIAIYRALKQPDDK